jgi:hypothetical protein
MTRLLQLSAPRQALVRLCQTINRGSIEGLEVRQSEPVFDPFPVTLKDVKLDKIEEPRPELALADFVLSSEVSRMLDLLDEMKCGAIRLIEVREGIPRRMLLESQEFGAADRGSRQAQVSGMAPVERPIPRRPA